MFVAGFWAGRRWSARQPHRERIAELLDQEATTRSRRMDPLLAFHHPELCRDVLLRQAHAAARLHTQIALVELTIPGFRTLAGTAPGGLLAERLYAEIRRHRRSLDIWLRWGADSFLLVLLTPSAEEAASVVRRLQSRLNPWWEQQKQGPDWPPLEWRHRCVESLGRLGDVVAEVNTLLHLDESSATAGSGAWQLREAQPHLPQAQFPENERATS